MTQSILVFLSPYSSRIPYSDHRVPNHASDESYALPFSILQAHLHDFPMLDIILTSMWEVFRAAPVADN